jgi:hypothetical protein
VADEAVAAASGNNLPMTWCCTSSIDYSAEYRVEEGGCYFNSAIGRQTSIRSPEQYGTGI